MSPITILTVVIAIATAAKEVLKDENTYSGVMLKYIDKFQISKKSNLLLN